jgi:hypothetical protein
VIELPLKGKNFSSFPKHYAKEKAMQVIPIPDD